MLKKQDTVRTAAENKLIVPLIQEIKFFKDHNLKEADLLEVISGLRYKEVSKGTYEMRYGDIGKIFYIILTGEVSIWVPIAP